jgi:hypothetical protein
MQQRTLARAITTEHAPKLTSLHLPVQVTDQATIAKFETDIF